MRIGRGAGLVLLAIVLLTGLLSHASPATAETVDCVSTQVWRQWASDNSETINAGHRSLKRASIALRRGVSQRGVSNNLYNAGRYLSHVSESPDGFASSFYHEAGRDFRQAASAVDRYRIRRASSNWADGNWNLKNAGNAISMCVNALKGQ